MVLEFNIRTSGRMVSFQMLCANIDAAESTEESADDITAAETAPRPKFNKYHYFAFLVIFSLKNNC